jgi:type II secretory pathway pseudopilin PulG
MSLSQLSHSHPAEPNLAYPSCRSKVPSPAPTRSNLQPSTFNLQPSRRAFTMIEIAISLAIIGFALVAIIGILPIGMNAQKENRHETIINQDATIFMEAIRNGAQGSDDLTNHVLAITNYSVHYTARGQASVTRFGYTFTNSTIGGALANPQFPITNGFRIIGLLCTPQIYPLGAGQGFLSNHVVAYVRSISGPASEKYPEKDPSIQDFGLSYKLICNVGSYSTNYFHPSWTNYLAVPTNSPEYMARYTYSLIASNLAQNLHDVRLTFRWPLLPNGDVGVERQVFRTMVGGEFVGTDDHGYPQNGYGGLRQFLFFFQPRTYVKAP